MHCPNKNAITRALKKIKNGDNILCDEAWPKLGFVPKNLLMAGQSFSEKLQEKSCDTSTLNLPEIWKVVQRHRRPKKANRVNHQDAPKQGSRFEVLAEEGETSAQDVRSAQVAQSVCLNADEKWVLHHTYKEQGGKEKEGGLKKQSKSQSKSQSISRGSKNRASGSQVSRKDKRLREMDHGKAKCNEVLCLTDGSRSTEEVICVGNDAMGVLELKEQGVGQLPPAPDDTMHFASGSLDPGDSQRLENLNGRFWAGPNHLDSEQLLMEGDSGDGPHVSGACAKSFLRQIRSICKSPNPDILILAETKCEREIQFRCLQKLGFDGLSFVSSLGSSGGLIVAWKSFKFDDVQVISTGRQFIHLRCVSGGRQPFFLSAIYSLPTPSLKSDLWQSLSAFASSISAPWVLLGDFNDCLSLDERVGGPAINFSRVRRFQDRLHSCTLTDLGSVGPRFTWRGPKLPNYARIFEKLDRALIEWDSEV
ncbi:hypothetical protein K1719_004814 [Acacia pycnantha]|nr:hypothetical protein K1719_004814 [Acacia pycnantha]